MGELPALVSDLALILIVAGVTTLIFKRLRQPLVLGYIVAGMLAGPAFNLFSLQDKGNVEMWAEIGVLFLLFSLGLEFSFKKLLSVGKTGIITAMTEVIGLLAVGYLVGMLMGWGPMNSLFLGGMLSMSSTAIIIKAFDDLNLSKKKFAGLVFGVLVVEDLVAIVLMVLLSTISTAESFSAWSMMTSVFRLVFFLTLWFVFGIYLIPSLLKKTRRLMNDETLLVVCVGMCLGMVVLAVKTGFSSALGAFIMGSILAETSDVKRIERMTKPLKDLFGAIFFVSVGMMVDLSVMLEYVWPIVIITLIVLIIKTLFTTSGMLLSGQPLKIAVQSGFSLAQIGEFSFIIAALGLSLKVTDTFLYPVAVTVSVLTTFLTPYMIRLSKPCGIFLLRHIPDKSRHLLLNGQAQGAGLGPGLKGDAADWITYLKNYTLNLLLNSIIILGILLLAMHFLLPLFQGWLPEGPWSGMIAAFVTLLFTSPFLKALMSNRRKTSTGVMMNLWSANHRNRTIMYVLMIVRVVVAFLYIAYILSYFIEIPVIGVLLIAFGILILIFRSKTLMRNYLNLESRFLINLNERQMDENIRRIEENHGVCEVRDMGEAHWLDRTLYAYSMKIGEHSSLFDKSLRELDFRTKYNLIVIRVERGKESVNIPEGDFVLRAGDILTLAGHNVTVSLLRDSSLNLSFVKDSLMTLHDFSHAEEKRKHGRLCCAGVPIGDASPLAGKTLKESNISQHKCQVIGRERNNQHDINPRRDDVIQSGDLIWLVGEEQYVSKLISANVYMI